MGARRRAGGKRTVRAREGGWELRVQRMERVRAGGQISLRSWAGCSAMGMLCFFGSEIG